MRTRRVGTALTTAVATAAVLALSGCTGGPDGHVERRSASTRPTGSSSAVPVGDRFAILTRPIAASDALPDGAVAPDALAPDSQRLAATRNGTSYWVAAQRDGTACLIAWNADPDSAENWSVCGGDPIPRAAVVTSTLDEHGHQTALVSDGFTQRADDPDALRRLADNVWVH